MNIDSPIFVPRNNAPMTSTPAAQLKVSTASLLDPKAPKSPLVLGDATPNAFGKLTDNNNIKHKNNNMGGYWPFVNNAAAYYPCGINSNYLQFCQQQQQQQHHQQQYLQHFVQRQRTLPNFHNQWTQRKNLNAAIGQRQQQQQQQRKQTTKTTATTVITTEVSAQQHQQRRKKQKMQQQAAQQQKQQQLTELQQQVNITKFPIANKTSDSLSPKLTVATTTTTNENQATLLLLPAAEEIININVVNDNNLNSNNIVIDKNTISNNNNNKKVDEDINMATLAAINIGTTALPNQPIQLVEEAEISSKQDDTVQRNGSRVGQQIRNPRYYQQQQQQQQHNSSNTQLNAKTDSSDSGISTNGRHQQHHHAHRQQPQQHNQKQRKTRLNSKRQDNNTTTITATTQKRTTEYTVDDWLGREMVYCYGHRYISSCAEDNLLATRHNPAHRNSTSSDAAASDDLNSSSSNEDLSAVYAVMSQPDKKTGNKARRNRQQRRRKRLDEQSADQLQAIPMDVDEDSKENRRPAQQQPQQQQQQQQQQQTAKATSVNLRKQCTKAAALKAVNKHNSGNNSNSNNAKSNSGTHALVNSASNSSVCSALSSASSTYSLSSSASSTSSAASSPTNSANCSPTASPTASKRNAENFRKIARALAPPLRQHTKLNMSEHELVQHLRRYIIDPNLLRVYGYPVESAIHEGCIEIYKCLPRPSGVHTHHSTTKTDVVNTVDGLQVHYASTSSSSSTTTNTGFKAQWTLVGDNSTDSGQGSGDSSPPSMDSDSSEAGEDEPATTTACFTPDGSYQIFSQYDQSLEKQCVRCMRTFHVTETGEYLSYESCTFHWGKLYNLYTGSKGYTTQYTCCAGTKDTEGCSRNPLHVWTGAVVGINGPYTDFVHTRARCDDKPTKVYALDCEMSFTGRGLEVTKVTVVGHDGQLVYEHFVRPEVEIVDYNTRFSGITEKDLCAHSNKNVKTLAEVQRDLLQLIDAETILIGHGLDNDLRVLRIVHKTIIDTSIAFPHSSGFPYRRALKNLTKACLNRDIQCSDAGHSSFEDSRACLELMLWKVRKEMRPTAY
ncbi:PREDICTED: probable WRKY transcription factor protein 1 [Bactrocera latifrons]|nr:PREDICTED: probable WRKY transcription factor protein 1 [Bactrocera latifrons]XP_018786533.1 PREDICTED: probable WRKY transcription factor protein 1 [Bactrocera latifrons]XP_018786534.1 PREDICTED: probable WRKY transcription factor protein 1 [Bactrocera latifrons]XP_018786535.1 PREDICTED: probable WRKY transcription factor protein 1 [Bactrocera latifrons]XP_018786536.1 PREDICTED: probable WRKY transcription factor protein 1 [Bactrocera latifrons]XP_018786537.1 PREDICTED: probable WRKY trans